MGANSFSLNRGAMTPDLHQAEAKRQMMALASKVILLCDSSKIGKVSFAQFARLDQLNVLVTDAIGKSEQHRLEKLGVEVVSV